jgi:hypothetical protein
MPISKNWKAIAINGIAGPELIVTGEANTGLLTITPELVKRIPPGINPAILQLNLLHATDGKPENFQKVQYNEKVQSQHKYKTIEIFHNNDSIETIQVIIE